MKKLNLGILKKVLCDENVFDNVNESKILVKDWSDGDVSVREWLDKFSSWWNLMNEIDGNEFGDSVVIEEILEVDYNLNKEEIEEIMKEYWVI